MLCANRDVAVNRLGSPVASAVLAVTKLAIKTVLKRDPGTGSDEICQVSPDEVVAAEGVVASRENAYNIVK